MTPQVGVPLRFITFEGGEGAGKSTQIRRLAAYLEGRGESVIVTREPGGTPGGEQIRNLLVEGGANRWHGETEALLHFAARAEHLLAVIRPALADGKWVLCDRFADSTIAYQGYGQGVDLAWLWQLRRHVVGATEPGLTLVLDMPVEAGLARATMQQRYERMGLDFHRRLAAGFRAIAAGEGTGGEGAGGEGAGRCRVIDATRDIETIGDEIRALVARHYGLPAVSRER